ncbi:MAG: hypothetical protein P0Y53_09955 [Candidatus Pseudobacter hemicellulosilyticus]|uniref:Uncharacterized protein n=1 Tax=Candidatus Pseudobacter hemicellulosilyticus TaxID=3121375 RepID=A0AAJ5WW09_9BACT|nr:MAG: hypothetical protein P0Y53_09955 [Pseudobacter sp.]
MAQESMDIPQAEPALPGELFYRAQMQLAFDTLPMQCRSILYFSFVQDKAALMEIRAKTVRNQRVIGRAKLKALLSP